MIKVTTPQGAAWLRIDEIAVIAECNGLGANHTNIRCAVWLRNHPEPFNLLETAEQVADIINGVADAL